MLQPRFGSATRVRGGPVGALRTPEGLAVFSAGLTIKVTAKLERAAEIAQRPWRIVVDRLPPAQLVDGRQPIVPAPFSMASALASAASRFAPDPELPKRNEWRLVQPTLSP